MAVLRKEKRDNFTVIDNSIFKNNRLSFKAKGLLCQMLSLPDGWEYSIAGLQTLASDQYAAITSGLRELEDAGYFRREQLYDKGKFAGYEYIISETPHIKNSDFTFSENPISENTISENPKQLNTKESNTNKSTTNEDIYTSSFEELWKLYPRKNGKSAARKAYIKACKDGVTFEEVRDGIVAYAKYIEATHTGKQFVKYGSAFFNQRAWEDDWEVVDNGAQTFGRAGADFAGSNGLRPGVARADERSAEYYLNSREKLPGMG